LNPVLASIIEPPRSQNGLKKDWAIEEKAWREGVGTFLQMILHANVDCAEKKKDLVDNGVIIKEKAGEPVVGPLAEQALPKQPSLPKEMKMTTDLDEIFGFAETPKQAKQLEEPKKEDLTAIAEASQESAFKDFPPTAKVSEPVVAQEPAPVKEETKQEKHETTKAPSEITLCEGFDEKTFKAKVMSVVDAILATTPEIDMEQMADSIDDYGVTISVDAYRSDLDTIANHIAEIQAKRDSIIGPLIKLSSTTLAIDEVLEFVVNIGVSCSSASNRERRTSEVHYMAGDLFKRYVHVKHLHDQYDKMYRHLGSQIDSLSRLLTAQIERAKAVYLGNQRHNDLREARDVSEGKVSPQPTPSTTLDLDAEIQRVQAAEPPQIPFDVDTKIPSKPTQVAGGLSSLETFSAAPVKSLEKFKKGVIEW